MGQKTNVAYIAINPHGSQLYVEIKFEGLIIGAYEYMLWEAESNTVLEVHQGNNQNPSDDYYGLPLPVNSNINRIIDVRARFVGLDPDQAPKFRVSAELFQGNQFIGDAYVASNPDRQLDGNGQLAQLYIFLQDESEL